LILQYWQHHTISLDILYCYWWYCTEFISFSNSNPSTFSHVIVHSFFHIFLVILVAEFNSCDRLIRFFFS